MVRRVAGQKLNILLLAVPAGWALHWMAPGSAWTFVVGAIAIVPLAGLIGDATEELAKQTGPTLGGFLNATFGNAAELIIAFVALDGESNWVEGLQQLALYAILGLAFYFLPGGAS